MENREYYVKDFNVVSDIKYHAENRVSNILKHPHQMPYIENCGDSCALRYDVMRTNVIFTKRVAMWKRELNGDVIDSSCSLARKQLSMYLIVDMDACERGTEIYKYVLDRNEIYMRAVLDGVDVDVKACVKYRLGIEGGRTLALGISDIADVWPMVFTNQRRPIRCIISLLSALRFKILLNKMESIDLQGNTHVLECCAMLCMVNTVCDCEQPAMPTKIDIGGPDLIETILTNPFSIKYTKSIISGNKVVSEPNRPKYLFICTRGRISDRIKQVCDENRMSYSTDKGTDRKVDVRMVFRSERRKKLYLDDVSHLVFVCKSKKIRASIIRDAINIYRELNLYIHII